MSNWARLSVLAVAAAVGAAAACSGAQTYTPPPKPGCPPIYAQNDPVAKAPHGAALCPSGPCNYQTQTGCAAGEVCSPHLQGTTPVPLCRPAGKLKKGDACDGSSLDLAKQCGIGLECASDGVCRTMCCGGDWTACDAGESCIKDATFAVKGEDAEISTGLELCYPVGGCNPLEPDSCAPKAGECRIADPLGRVACLDPKTLDEGQPCSGANQCAGGLLCAGEPLTCRKLCPWGQCAPAVCTNAEGLCVHFTRDPSGVGECTPKFHGVPVVVDGGFVGDAEALLPPPPVDVDGG